MSNIFTGNGFKLFYNTDTGNQLPDSYKNTQIESLAVMPNVTFNSDTNTIEVYDGYYSTKLLGDKTVNDIEIVVNYIPDNPSHAFLDNAVETQQEFQLIIQYQTDEEGMIDYSIINGQLSSKQITGDKDEVVQATYTFSPSEVAIRSARAAASIPLVEGSYGVGSNGDTVPQYQPELPTGNSFIKIPAASTDNPAGSDVMGIGLIDQDTFSSLAMTKSGALALYAKNGSTAWTRIVTSPMADAKYLPFSGGTITGNLSITGILTLTNPLAVANGGTGAATVTSARTNLDVYSRGEVDAIDVVLDTKIDTINDNLNSKINAAEEVLDTKIDTVNDDLNSKVNAMEVVLDTKIDIVNDDLNSKIDQVNTDISNVYTKAQIDTTVAMLVPKTTTVNGKALSENITLTKTDVGLGNVTNDLQLKAASNLSDLNNVATARGNLGLTALGLGGTPTTLSTMDWLTQLFVVGGLYVVAAGGMTNVPADLIFEDATTITMIRVVATDGTFLTCEVWPSTSTASKFRMYNVRFPAGTTSNRTFWVRQIFDNSGVIPVINGGTGATTAAAARTNLGFGTVATYNIGTSGETIPLLSTANTWSSNQSIQGNLSVGASAQTSTINLGGSSFSRDNGTSALIITSNSGSTSGSAGLYLRPMGDTVSTVQLYGNSTGWTFQGALNASSTLRVNGATTLSGSLAVTGASTFSGSYNGNRAAIDLTGSTTDLNSCFVAATSSGHEQVWICTTQGGGTNITNKPPNITGSFWLQSASTRINGVADSGYVQTLYSYETSRTYVRYGKSTFATAGTWSVWQEQATIGNANTWTADQTFSGTSSSVMIKTSGGIEVAGATPYIDFHYTNTTADFNTRIINDANNTLSILAGSNGVGRLRIDGGYQCKRGITGEFNANAYNYFWNTSSALELWVDAVNLGSVALNPNSDKGLKKDIEYLSNESDVLTEVKQWKPATFKYKARGGLIPESETKYGFIANDLVKVSPDCVKGKGLPYDYDIVEDPNNPNAYSLDTVAMIAKLTQAIQEQQKIIESIQEQINSNK